MLQLNPLRACLSKLTSFLKTFSQEARDAALEARRAKGKGKGEESPKGKVSDETKATESALRQEFTNYVEDRVEGHIIRSEVEAVSDDEFKIDIAYEDVELGEEAEYKGTITRTGDMWTAESGEGEDSGVRFKATGKTPQDALAALIVDEGEGEGGED